LCGAEERKKGRQQGETAGLGLLAGSFSGTGGRLGRLCSRCCGALLLSPVRGARKGENEIARVRVAGG